MRVWLLLLLGLALVIAAGCGSSHRSCSAKGGSEVILRAVPNRDQHVTAAGMQTAQQIIENRVNKIGVSSPTVTVQSENEIVIHFSGTKHPVEVAKVIGSSGQLQMFDFEPSLAAPTVTRNQQPAPLPSLYAVLTAVKKEADKGSPQSYYLFRTGRSHSIAQGPDPTIHALLSPYKNGKQPAGTEVLRVPANRLPVFCRMARSCPGAGRSGTSRSGAYWYLFKYYPDRPDSPPQLTGRDLVESGITADADPNTGQPIVTLQFTRHGSKEFQRITEAEYNRGRIDAGLAGVLTTRNQSTIARYAGHNAIVLDGELRETPYIDYTDPALSQGIVGSAQITEPTTQAARQTALVLQSGSLPYTFRLVELSRCSG